MPPATQPSIAIIGGSITGPTLALRLLQEGFQDVHVFEASPQPTALAGGIIGLEHTALGVLDTIGVPQEQIIPYPSERVVTIKVADQLEAGRVQTLYPGRNTIWQLINNSLLSRLPAEHLHTAMRATAIGTDENNRARVEFANGTTVSADLVVFADGRRSVGRQLLDPGRQLGYAGVVAWRGQSSWLPADMKDFTRYEPLGTRLAIFPTILRDGSVGTDWTFYLPMTTEHFKQLCGGDPVQRVFVLPHQVTPAAKLFVTNMTAELLPAPALQLMEHTTSWAAAPLLTIDPPKQMIFKMGGSRALLIGDALAPVFPLTGRGANNGIEQADALVTVLTQCYRYDANVDAALQGWQRRMLPTVEQALQLGPQLAQGLGLRPTPYQAANLRSVGSPKPSPKSSPSPRGTTGVQRGGQPRRPMR
ncbi:FAD binding domain-containing protein [Sphaerisporangium flaviroseum]|uniref:FAD binding domain-containing protein n=2 Tax=Sphaerisporangium flaviroseum TaxID=509199 RepID=A0ABP7J0Z6_9ACTN